MYANDRIILTPQHSVPLNEAVNLYSDKHRFYLQPGTYEITEPLVINRNNVHIIGMDGQTEDGRGATIVQTTEGRDGVVVSDTNNVSIQNVAIQVPDAQGIALTVEDSRWVQIQRCQIHGSPSYFAVYISGPSFSQGMETLEGYEANALTNNITFDNNVVYAAWEGDAVAIGLQNGCSVRNNLIRGGKLAIYLCRDTMVTGNRVLNSSSHGIYCSLPSDDLCITHNTIVTTEAAAIMLKPQLEHGTVEADPSNILVAHNQVFGCATNGIEINDTWNVTVEDNMLHDISEYGVLLVRTKDVKLQRNTVKMVKIAVNVVSSERVIACDNSFLSLYPNLSQYGVLLQEYTDQCNVSGNKFRGQYLSQAVSDFSVVEGATVGPDGQPTATTDNTTVGNDIAAWMSIQEELLEE